MSDLNVALNLFLRTRGRPELKALEKDLSSLRANAARLNGKPARDLSAGLQAAARAAQTTTVPLNRLVQSTSKLEGGARKAGLLASALEKVRRSAESASQAVKKINMHGGGAFSKAMHKGSSLGSSSSIDPAHAAAAGAAAGRYLPALGLAGGGAASAVALTAAATRQSISREKLLYELQKSENLDAGQLPKLSRELDDMAVKTGIAYEALAQMRTQAGYAGRPVEDLGRFTEYAAKATGAWGVSAEETGSALAQIGSIYKATQERIEAIGDAVNYAADTSGARESDLLEILRRSGGQGQMLGISAEKVIALGAALKDIGVGTEVAATGLNALFTNMALGEDATKEFEDGLEALGIQTKTFKKSVQKDATGTIMKLLEAIDQVPEGIKKIEILKQLFGREYADDIARLTTNLPVLKRLMRDLGDQSKYVGSVSKGFELVKDKDFNRIDRMTNAVKALGDELIGLAGKSILGKVADTVTQAAETARNDVLGVQEGKPSVTKQGFNSLYNWVTKGPQGMDPDGFKRNQDQVKAGLEKELQPVRAERARKELERAIRQRSTEGGLWGPNSARIRKLDGDITGWQNIIANYERARAGRDNAKQALDAYQNLSINQPRQAGKVGSGLTAFNIFGPSGIPVKAPIPPSRPKELSQSLNDAAQSANKLRDALGEDLSGQARAAFQGYNGALDAALKEATAKVKAAAEQMKNDLSFTARPTIQPRLSSPNASPISAPSSGEGATLQKARARGSDRGITIQQVNVHGVRDLEGLQRQLTRMADRSTMQARDGALHDLG